MQLVVIIFAIALTFFTGSNAQSTTPACIVCPPVDNAGTLNDVPGSVLTSDPIVCYYPQNSPEAFFCTYGRVSGALVTDSDQGNCPLTTVTTCTSRRKRNALPRSPRLPRSGPRAERANPMKIRQKLGAVKRRERHAK